MEPNKLTMALQKVKPKVDKFGNRLRSQPYFGVGSGAGFQQGIFSTGQKKKKKG